MLVAKNVWKQGQYTYKLIGFESKEEMWQRQLIWQQINSLGQSAPNSWKSFGRHSLVVTKWIQGKTLRKFLLQSLSRVQMFQFLSMAGLALERMHSQYPAILHGDLSPANLIVDVTTKKVTWIDWQEADCQWRQLSRDIKHFWGKPAYLAPERAQTGRNSILGEVFSLGAIAFEIFVGSQLFTNDEAGFQRSLRFNVREWLVLCREYQLPGVISAAIHPNPQRRPKVLELAKNLSRLGNDAMY